MKFKSIRLNIELLFKALNKGNNNLSNSLLKFKTFSKKNIEKR